MPLLRYFVFVGGALVALLLVSNAVLPKLPVAEVTNTASELPMIRITPRGNGRSALSSTPASPRSFRHRPPARRRTPRPRRSPTLRRKPARATPMLS